MDSFIKEDSDRFSSFLLDFLEGEEYPKLLNNVSKDRDPKFLEGFQQGLLIAPLLLNKFISSTDNKSDSTETEAEALEALLKDFYIKSQDGNDHEWWVDRVFWDENGIAGTKKGIGYLISQGCRVTLLDWDNKPVNSFSNASKLYIKNPKRYT